MVTTVRLGPNFKNGPWAALGPRLGPSLGIIILKKYVVA